jgi:TPR repeat protein
MSVLSSYRSNNQFNKGELLYKSIFRESMLTGGTIEEAFKYFIKAASNGHVKSQLRIYQLYRMCGTDGPIYNINKVDSINMLKNSASSGDPDAQYLLGQLYLEGDLNEYNRYELAYELFETSGNAKSIANQGYMLYHGLNGTMCRKDAFKKYYLARQMGWYDKHNSMKNMFGDDSEWL